MARLNRDELLYIGYKLEEKSVELYAGALKCSVSRDLKALFKQLITLEKKHLDFFSKMSDGHNNFKIRDNFAGDALLYLEAISAEGLLSFIESPNVCPAEGASPSDIVDLALTLETHSILFYKSLIKHASLFGKSQLNRMLAEEERHRNILQGWKNIIAGHDQETGSL